MKLVFSDWSWVFQNKTRKLWTVMALNMFTFLKKVTTGRYHLHYVISWELMSTQLKKKFQKYDVPQMINCNNYDWKSCDTICGQLRIKSDPCYLGGRVVHQVGTGVNRWAEWWSRLKENPNCFTISSILNACNKVTTIML